MADQNNSSQDKSMSARAGAVAGTTQNAGQKGGEQPDQITGQTPKGAHNQENENRNPTGNNPNPSQGGR
jgi:hypothetical protein